MEVINVDNYSNPFRFFEDTACVLLMSFASTSFLNPRGIRCFSVLDNVEG